MQKSYQLDLSVAIVNPFYDVSLSLKRRPTTNNLNKFRLQLCLNIAFFGQ